MASFNFNTIPDQNPFKAADWYLGATDGLDWHDVKSVGGQAYGTQAGNTNFDDSIACLKGSWSFHQRIRGTCKVNNRVTAGTGSPTAPFIEFELLLHFTITAHTATGYELTISNDAVQHYVQINRWNGALGSFTNVGSVNLSPAPVTGDVFEFRDEGTSSVPLLRVYYNGAFLFEYDTTPDGTKYTAGSPGIGFYNGQGGATNVFQDYCGWTSFSATDDYLDGECVQSVSANGGSSGTSQTLAFTNNTVYKNLLVCALYHAGTGGTATFTDTQGNDWTNKIINRDQTTDGHQIHLAWAYAKQSAPCSVTAVFSSSATTFRSMILAEYRITGVVVHDASANTQGTTGTLNSGATGVTLTAPQLCIAVVGGDNSGGSRPDIAWSTNGSNNAVAATTFQLRNSGPNTQFQMALYDKLKFALATQTVVGTITAQNWSIILETFKLLSSTDSRKRQTIKALPRGHRFL